MTTFCKYFGMCMLRQVSIIYFASRLESWLWTHWLQDLRLRLSFFQIYKCQTNTRQTRHNVNESQPPLQAQHSRDSHVSLYMKKKLRLGYGDQEWELWTSGRRNKDCSGGRRHKSSAGQVRNDKYIFHKFHIFSQIGGHRGAQCVSAQPVRTPGGWARGD